MIKVKNWLSPPDPWKNYNIARHNDAGGWFVKGDTVSEWKNSRPSSLLWINGKRQLPSAYIFAQRLIILSFLSGRWQERSLVSEPLDIPFSRTYNAG